MFQLLNCTAFGNVVDIENNLNVAQMRGDTTVLGIVSITLFLWGVSIGRIIIYIWMKDNKESYIWNGKELEGDIIENRRGYSLPSKAIMI